MEINDGVTCNHNWVKTEGLWDGHDDNKPGEGKNTGGPVMECSKCFEKKFMSWEDFKSFQETKAQE